MRRRFASIRAPRCRIFSSGPVRTRAGSREPRRVCRDKISAPVVAPCAGTHRALRHCELSAMMPGPGVARSMGRTRLRPLPVGWLSRKDGHYPHLLFFSYFLSALPSWRKARRGAAAALQSLIHKGERLVRPKPASCRHTLYSTHMRRFEASASPYEGSRLVFMSAVCSACK